MKIKMKNYIYYSSEISMFQKKAFLIIAVRKASIVTYICIHLTSHFAARATK